MSSRTYANAGASSQIKSADLVVPATRMLAIGRVRPRPGINCSIGWLDHIVPFGVEFVANEVDGHHLRIGDDNAFRIKDWIAFPTNS